MFGWLKKGRSGEAAAAPAAAMPAVPDPGARSEALRKEGNGLLEQGRLDEAAARYREAVALDPGAVGARINLGYVLIELNRPSEAEPELQQAAALDGGNVDAQFMLGNLASARGEHARAIGCYEKAIELRPDFGPAYAAACRSLVSLGQAGRAEAILRRGLAHGPPSAELHFLLGNLCLQAGRAEPAAEAYAQALAIGPDRAELHENLALAQIASGSLDAAAASYAKALSLQPDAVSPRYAMALLLQRLGRGAAAAEQLQRVIALAPGHFDAHLNLGVVLQGMDDAEAALRCYRLALALKPGAAAAHCNLGIALAAQGRRAEALAAYEQALRCDPGHARSHAALAVELHQMGRPEEAVDRFRAALAIDPDDLEAHSSLLFLLSFVADPKRYLDEARHYGAKLAERARPVTPALADAPFPAPARWRIGLVSGDLRRHPVALFLEGVLANLDRSRIEVFAYATSAQSDDVSARLKQFCAGWTPIVGMDDEVAARRIHSDGVHVLIDLAGHTAHNRLPVFAWRPAPLQVSWLGYFASTGVPAMDFVLADPVSLPPALHGQFTESIWNLPHTRLCFTAPTEPLQVADAPAAKNGHVTFGSFQSLSKLNDGVLQAWSDVLSAVPGSRLRLQAKQLDQAQIRQELLQRLESNGIAADRVALFPAASRESYLAAHAEVDIILDTFPYPGGTTTCEALWMGVPTLTLAGNTLLSRQGVAMLSNAGLEDWVADDQADYVLRAARHAGDLRALARLRAGLRERVIASPLFDAPRFARDFEQALQGMWRQASQPASGAGA